MNRLDSPLRLRTSERRLRPTIPFHWFAVAWCVASLPFGFARAGEPSPIAATNEIRLLIVTGIDYPGHKWRETTPYLVDALSQDERMRVDVLADPYRLAAFDLRPYHGLVLHFMNWEKPDPDEAARENLRRFVSDGGGLVMIHFACGAFQGWPEFANVAGRVYDRTNSHDPRGPFTVNLVKSDHPITRGLPSSFETDDELYTCLTGTKPVVLLANALSKVTRTHQPMGFVHQYGKGRVFLTPLGHDVRALRAPGTTELIRRASAWVAGHDPKHLWPPPPSKPNAADVEKQFKLPPGFEIRLVASEPDIANPMTMCVDDKGTVWVTEAHTYRWGPEASPFERPGNPIKRIELGPDGRAARTIVAAEGFAEPVMGVAVRDGQLYATCLNELFVMDILPDGRLGNRRLLVKDAAIPWNPFGMYRVAIGPDDRLWLAIADHPSTQPIELTGADGRVIKFRGQSGGMVRCRRDGTGLELIVQGFRAPYAFDFDPWGHLWHVSNGEGSPNLYLHVIPGVDYGYATRNASYAWLAGSEPLSPPVRDMGAGANTAALQYYSSMFPRDYSGSVFVANWGSHGRAPANRDIRVYRREANGESRIGSAGTELTGGDVFLNTADPRFRPTQIALAPDGGLFVIDWHGDDDENDRTGRLYKIFHPEQNSVGVVAKASEVSELTRKVQVTLLGHSNHLVRALAQRALQNGGDSSVESMSLAIESADPLTAANIIWTLTCLDTPAAATALARGLAHADGRVRSHALRQLRQVHGQNLSGTSPATSPDVLAALAAPLLADVDAEVRVEAALAQSSAAEIVHGLVTALEKASEPRLRYQIGFHLARRAEVSTITSMLKSTSGGVRTAALIALDIARHEGAPLAARMRESNPAVFDEVAPAKLSEKFTWLRQRKPAELDAEFKRIESGEIVLTAKDDKLAALAALDRSYVRTVPKRWLLAMLADRDEAVLTDAMRAVRRCAPNGSEFTEAARRILKSANTPPPRLEALYWLGLSGDETHADDWTQWLEHRSNEMSVAALRALRQVGQKEELIDALVKAAPGLAQRNDKLANEVAFTFQSLAIPTDRCSVPLPKVDPATPKTELANAILARTKSASAALGHLTFHSSKGCCSSCHSTAPGELRFGPSLADIGATAQPQYIVESILEPHKVIKTGFQMESIEREGDEPLQGLVEARGDQLLVRISFDEQVAVPLTKARRRTPSQLSPMPEGFEAALSSEEIADLAAYLMTLKPN